MTSVTRMIWVTRMTGVTRMTRITQCSSQKFLLEGQSGPYNPFLGARYFKKGPMYQYLSMQKRRNSWKVKEMKMAVYYFEADMAHPSLYTKRKSSVIKQTVQSECMQ